MEGFEPPNLHFRRVACYPVTPHAHTVLDLKFLIAEKLYHFDLKMHIISLLSADFVSIRPRLIARSRSMQPHVGLVIDATSLQCGQLSGEDRIWTCDGLLNPLPLSRRTLWATQPPLHSGSMREAPHMSDRRYKLNVRLKSHSMLLFY